MKNLNFLQLTFLLLLFLLNSSCKRLDGETIVEGKVVDRNTGAHVPNARLVLFSSDGRSVGGAYNTVELEKQADGDGNFSFSFNGKSSKNYALRAFTDLGHFTEWTEAAYLEEGRNNKKLKLKVHSPAWVKVKLVNVPPKNQIAQFHIQGFQSDSKGSSSVTLNFLQEDTTFIRVVMGNRENGFLYIIKEMNASENNFNIYKFSPALDTTELIINY